MRTTGFRLIRLLDPKIHSDPSTQKGKHEMSGPEAPTSENREPVLFASTMLPTGWHAQFDAALLTSLNPKGRVLVFMDILGWRQHIEDGDFAACQCFIALVDQCLAGHVKYNSENGSDVQVSMMSDTLLLSTPISTPQPGRDLRFVLGVAVNYVIAAHTLGLLVRGSMVAGSLCHSGQMCFGTALHKAYDLERAVADVPRLVVDETCQGVLHGLFGWQPGQKGGSFAHHEALPESLREDMDVMIGCPLQTSDDGIVHFNWLWQDTMCILDGLHFAARNVFYRHPYSAKIARKINWYLKFLNQEGLLRGSTPWDELTPVAIAPESDERVRC